MKLSSRKKLTVFAENLHYTLNNIIDFRTNLFVQMLKITWLRILENQNLNYRFLSKSKYGIIQLVSKIIIISLIDDYYLLFIKGANLFELPFRNSLLPSIIYFYVKNFFSVVAELRILCF